MQGPVEAKKRYAWHLRNPSKWGIIEDLKLEMLLIKSKRLFKRNPKHKNKDHDDNYSD